MTEPAMPRGVLYHWGAFLPLTEKTPRITLGEGDTPLVRSVALAGLCGLDELWFKLEMCNPTGSFKDRGMVVAVAKAVESGAHAIMCASTGNTSASAAAYAAHCGIESYVLVPGGKVAAGKLAQAIACGTRIIQVDGNFDEALSAARELTTRHPVALVNSVNPDRIQGQKTAAFEICESLGDAPDLLVLSTLKPLLPRSASATPRAGLARRPRATKAAGSSKLSRTMRSSRPMACSPRRKACSPSRRAPRPWPGCSSWAGPGVYVAAGQSRS
jgi:Pyridoxal-phosphate dependent enzyme